MPTYSETRTGRQPFVADRDSLDHNTGHNIDWAQVTAAYGVAGERLIPAGTVMAQLPDGRLAPRAIGLNSGGAAPVTYPANAIIATDATENSRTDALSGYGVILGGVIYENLLPEATGTPRTLPAAFRTELQDNGTGFAFRQYVDSSAV